MSEIRPTDTDSLAERLREILTRLQRGDLTLEEAESQILAMIAAGSRGISGLRAQD